MSVVRRIRDLKDCTPQCTSQKHIRDLIALVTLPLDIISDLELVSYLKHKSYCFTSQTDEFGRSVLHMAASCGRTVLCDWLLRFVNINVNVQDLESGYTALHRSIFYGHLDVAATLIKHGADMYIKDNEGITPLDMVMEDPDEYEGNLIQSEVYTWGTNTNYTSGFRNEHSKSEPQLLEYFHKRSINIKQVCMHEFHTLFVCSIGNVFSCGLGQGGRLGLGNEDTVLLPQQIYFSSSKKISCINAAIGRDHSVFLCNEGRNHVSIMTCGLNNYHQLGISRAKSIIKPKRVPLPSNISDSSICGVAASTYHTVVWTTRLVFACGFHGGQLGFPHSEDETVDVLTEIPFTLCNYDYIVHVAVSDGATVVFTNNSWLHIFHSYKHIKIDSSIAGHESYIEVPNVKITAYGGCINAMKDKHLVPFIEEKLTILMLVNNNVVFKWKEDTQDILKCCMPNAANTFISDIGVNKQAILLISNGVAYICEINYHTVCTSNIGIEHRKIYDVVKKHTCNDNYGKWRSIAKSSGWRRQTNGNEFYKMNMQRVPLTSRACFIFSDPKGNNFSVIQKVLAWDLENLPAVIEDDFKTRMGTLLPNYSELPMFYDIVYEVESVKFPAHRYIMSCSSELLGTLPTSEKSKTVLLWGTHPDIFRQLIKFAYTQDCDFLHGECNLRIPKTYKKVPIGHCVKVDDENNLHDILIVHSTGTDNTLEDSSSDEEFFDSFTLALIASHEWRMNRLTSVLEEILPHGQCIRKSNRSSLYKDLLEKPGKVFDKEKYPSLCDMVIESSDHKCIYAHKCILSSYDYFNLLLSGTWKENAGDICKVHLPFKCDVLNEILNFCYTGNVDVIRSFNFWCNMLVASDQLLLQRLKEICEMKFLFVINSQNVCSVLQYAVMYNAKILKRLCLVFINLNMQTILENRQLDELNNELLKEISESFLNFNYIGKYKKRRISQYCNVPDLSDIRLIHKQFPVELSVDTYDDMVFKMSDSSIPIDDETFLKKRKSRNIPKRQKNYRYNNTAQSDNMISQSDDIRHESLYSIDDDVKISTSTVGICNKDEDWLMKLSKTKSRLRAISAAYNCPEILNYNETFSSLPFKTPDKSDNIPVSKPQRSEYSTPQSCHQLTLNIDGLNITPKLTQRQWKKMQSSQSVSNENTEHTLSNSPKLSSSAWNVSSSPENIDFSQIMTSEINRKKTSHKVAHDIKMKTLEQMQMEDKAIQELIVFYNAKEVDEEHITVHRVPQDGAATPQWISKPNKVNKSNAWI